MPKDATETKETQVRPPEYHLMVPTLKQVWDESQKRINYLELGLAQLEGFQALLEGERSAISDGMLTQFADFLGNHSDAEREAFKKQFKQSLPNLIAEEFALSAEESLKKTDDDSPVKKVRFKFRSPLGKKSEAKTDVNPSKYLDLLKKQIGEQIAAFEAELYGTDITIEPKKGITVEQDLEAKHRPLEQFQQQYHNELQQVLPAIKQNEVHQKELFEQCANVFNGIEGIQRAMDKKIQELERLQSRYHLDPNYYQTKEYEEYRKEDKIEQTTTIDSKIKKLPMNGDAEVAKLKADIAGLDAQLRNYQNLFNKLPHSEVSIPGLKEQDKFGYLQSTQNLEQRESKKLPLPDALLQQKDRIDAAGTQIKANIEALKEKMTTFDNMIGARKNFEQKLQAYRQRETTLIQYFKKDVGVFPVHIAEQHRRHPIIDAASANLNPLNIFGSRHCRQERRQDYMLALKDAMQNYVKDENKAGELISVISEGWTKKSTNLHNVLQAFLSDLESQSTDFKALVADFEAQKHVNLHI